MNVSGLIEILPTLGIGLGGVFLVIIIIWASIAGLIKFVK